MKLILGVLLRLPRVLAFLTFYLKEVVLANLRVARDILAPRLRLRPGVVAIPLAASSDLEISILANLLTMTPGSLSLDVSSDRRVLYLHVMNMEDVESLRREIQQGFERRVLEVMR